MKKKFFFFFVMTTSIMFLIGFVLPPMIASFDKTAAVIGIVALVSVFFFAGHFVYCNLKKCGKVREE